MTLFGSAELTRHSGSFLIDCRCSLSREKPQPCVHNSSTALMERSESKISNFLKSNLAILLHRLCFLVLLCFVFNFPRASRQKIFQDLYGGGATMCLRNLQKKEIQTNHCGSAFMSPLFSEVVLIMRHCPWELLLLRNRTFKRTHQKNVDLCRAEWQVLKGMRSTQGFCFDCLESELLTWANLWKPAEERNPLCSFDSWLQQFASQYVTTSLFLPNSRPCVYVSKQQVLRLLMLPFKNITLNTENLRTRQLVYHVSAPETWPWDPLGKKCKAQRNSCFR